MKTIKNISRNNLSKSPKFPRISRNMPNLLKEWSEQQTNEAEKIIFEWLRSTEFWTLSRGAEKETKTFRSRVWGKCDEILGLAYTSSSSLTALYINNVTLHAPVEACALDLMDALHWAEFPPVYTVRAFAYDGVSVWALVENSDDERDYYFYNITNPAERDAQTLRALYALEIAKIFPDMKMIDYCAKRLSNVVMLSGGELVAYEKRKIQKDFCFGYNTDYSGHEHADAHALAMKARKDEKYIIAKNTAKEREKLAHFSGIFSDSWRTYSPYIQCEYIKGNIWRLVWLTDYDKEASERVGVRLRRVEGADLEKLEAVAQEELTKREKQIKTYLKKYGTNSVRTWAYWKDE